MYSTCTSCIQVHITIRTLESIPLILHVFYMYIMYTCTHDIGYVHTYYLKHVLYLNSVIRLFYMLISMDTVVTTIYSHMVVTHLNVTIFNFYKREWYHGYYHK